MLQAQERDTSFMYQDESKRLIYRKRWYEAADLVSICNDRGYTQAACRFRRSAACSRKAEVLGVGLVGGAVLGYMSTWQDETAGMNPVASGFLIAAGSSGLAGAYYAIRSRSLLKSGMQAFNNAVEIEMGRALRCLPAIRVKHSRRACNRMPFLSDGKPSMMRHRLTPRALTDMVVFDGQMMSFEKAARYADDNSIAGAGDVLRQLAALKKPQQAGSISSSPIALNDKAMRDYISQKNRWMKDAMQAVRRHNREVRKGH